MTKIKKFNAVDGQQFISRNNAMNSNILALTLILTGVAIFKSCVDQAPSLKNFHHSDMFDEVERAIQASLETELDSEKSVAQLFKSGDLQDLVNKGFLAKNDAKRILMQTHCKNLQGIRFNKLNDELTLRISEEVCEGQDVASSKEVKTFEYNDDDTVLIVSRND